MSLVLNRFLNYVSMDTTSDPESTTFPSTSEKQHLFADKLRDELLSLGLTDAVKDEFGYVFATIPSTIQDYQGPVLGFIAHMDTAPDAPGDNIHPRVIDNYDGKDIPLGNGLVLSPAQFPSLLGNVGKTLVVTDGSTLLGGDDKAGLAEIVAAAEYLLQHPEIPHGPIRIGFTPDEEVGQGVDHFDVSRFGADFAYTMDGGELGELEYENFNAANAQVEIAGTSIHPGSAKGKMISALAVGMELCSLLPAFEKPEYTEGREGFTHLTGFYGSVDRARLNFIIRDHDQALFEKKKAFLQTAADFLNQKYGPRTVTVAIEDSYFNMKEKVAPYPFLLDYVKEVYGEMGIAPIIVPIRGGTDGARLSFMGLPCPNLGTGDYNCHGRYEYVCVEKMKQAVEVIVRLCQKFAAHRG